MANQYITALQDAAQYLGDDLQRYPKIEIASDGYLITWRDTAIPIGYGTSKRKCLTILRRLIRAEKRIELETQRENNVSIFEELNDGTR